MKHSAETLLLQRIWLQAFEKEEIEIAFNVPAESKRLRFRLYNFAKAVRTNPEHFPALLLDAVENCSISCCKAQDGKVWKHLVIIRHKTKETYLQEAAEQLGINVNSLIQPPPPPERIEEEALAGLEKLEALLQGANGGAAQVSADLPPRGTGPASDLLSIYQGK